MHLIQWLENRPPIKRWVRRRLPRCTEVTLTQRQIFVFLTREGWLFGFLLLITFLAGVNYANNLILSVFFLLSSILIIGIYHSYAQLSGLRIKVIHADDSVAGEQARYQIELSPTTAKCYCQLEIFWQQYQRIAILNDKQILHFDLDTPGRGRFTPPRLMMQSVYPLGLIRAWTYIYFDKDVWVSPMPIESERNALNRIGGEGEETHGLSGQEEFFELKNYVKGESLSRVSWTHLAKGQGLLSKQFIDFCAEQDALNYEQMPAIDHETRLSQMAYWVHALSEQNIAFSMTLPTAQLPLGQGEQHTRQALRLLAQEP
ncbi:DUF58 domain-containing protein [Alkanindiges sp. WGS2144]|uniref:DUF58 domain-containing protein n=1 Tax=Alkanindiges sp. WGS2144 TaxID=3366808 RepID=UPI0037521DDD